LLLHEPQKSVSTQNNKPTIKRTELHGELQGKEFSSISDLGTGNLNPSGNIGVAKEERRPRIYAEKRGSDQDRKDAERTKGVLASLF
jgi:hypothetical protein